MTAGQLAYQEYLESDHWRNLRATAYRKYGRRCSRCPVTIRLEVHHTIYRNPWTAGTVDDLVILCCRCHELEHGIATVKQPKHRKKKKKRNWAKIAAEHSAMLDRQMQKRRQPTLHPQQRIPNPPRKKKSPRWWPGMYEGKSPGDTFKEVGTFDYESPSMKRTPGCMNPKNNRHH